MGLRGRQRRREAVVAGVLLMAGALCERGAVYAAGNESAEDPRYTVIPQRERLERRQAWRQAEHDAGRRAGGSR